MGRAWANSTQLVSQLSWPTDIACCFSSRLCHYLLLLIKPSQLHTEPDEPAYVIVINAEKSLPCSHSYSLHVSNSECSAYRLSLHVAPADLHVYTAWPFMHSLYLMQLGESSDKSSWVTALQLIHTNNTADEDSDPSTDTCFDMERHTCPQPAVSLSWRTCITSSTYVYICFVSDLVLAKFVAKCLRKLYCSLYMCWPHIAWACCHN